MIEPNKLSPFRHFCMTIGAIPSSYKESLTYYEMLEWLCKYLQDTVIPAVNNNAEALEELQSAFITLKDYVDHYFDDLDIQTEINNKLDEMADSGELAQIIAQYIQLAGILAYDSVADLKAAENLVDGSLVKTYGYYDYNDGGGAFYKVRNIINTDVPDDVTIIALHDVSLVAELLIDKINVKQFGAKGDGVTDDTVAIQNAFSYLRTYPRAAEDYAELYFPDGEYIISDTILIDGGRWSKVYGRASIKANMNKPMIKLNSTMWYVFSDLLFWNSNTSSNSCAIEIENSYTNKFQDIYIQGGYKGINIVYGNQLMFDNVSIQQCTYGVYTMAHGNNTENMFNNCTMEVCTLYNIYLGYDGVNSYYGKYMFNNCYIEGSPSEALIYIENGMHAVFNDCYINATTANNTIIHQTGTLPYMKASFNNCYFTGNTNVYLIKQLADNGIVKGVKFDNKCYFTSDVKLYNTGDAIRPKIGKINRDKLNVFNLTNFELDTNNKVIGWLGTGTYTTSATIDPESLYTVDVSNGYIYKKIYLKAGVTYDFEVMTKATSNYSSLELFNENLDAIYFQQPSYSTSWTRLVKTYTPNVSQVFTLLIRSHTNTSSFCGLRIYSNELDLEQNRSY